MRDDGLLTTCPPCIVLWPQVLSNGKPVGYDNTLKVVEHEAGKMPRLPPKQTNKHKGFIRNALGGFFTS